MIKRFILIFLPVILALSACGSPPATGTDTTVLTSATFLADIARNVAGDRLKIEALLPVGADPHSYQPTPQDMAKLEKCQLLIINGAEYEHFLEPFIAGSGGGKKIVEASAKIDLRKAAEGEHAVDPHAWLDPNLVMVYVENIRAALTEYDPAGAATYQANADAYIAQLKDLDAWIQAQVGQIPAGKRILVTNHESLNYFAARYGFEVAGAVVPSFSGNAAPSAQQMAGLIDEIRKLGVAAIFLDAADNDALARQIADETGARVVSDLHLESLTEGAPAATYLDMLKHNVTQIVGALK